ncbi:Hypothetical protein PENO1_108190 [Penicillium occitanis (nom. inval.)]|nr:Hypothetical protein PENO1_108190 [Penicillium occitanis (nom. inval.)]PCG89090.1 hypothetical protein PENOC_108110 [Penicillium occitanis (nom. inval.)]
MGGISQRQPNGSQRDWRHHPHDHITGDWDGETDIDIWAPKKVKMVTCNGSKPKVRKPKYANGWWQTISQRQQQTTTIPTGLGSKMLIIRKLLTWFPRTRIPVLFADEYGTSSAEATPMLQRMSHPLALIFVSLLVLPAVSQSTPRVSFEDVPLNMEGDNVHFVTQETMGKEQREGAPDPRSILNAMLITTGASSVNFSFWKVAANAGGNHLLERIRGTYNEGVLHEKRLGWHLSGFNNTAWES